MKVNSKHQIPNFKQLLNSKNQNRKHFGVNFFGFLICFGFVILNFGFNRVSLARAADISLVVSPPRTDLVIKPGETLQKNVKMTNTSDTELILGVTVVDFIVTDDIGTPIKVEQEASGRFLASPWFTLTTDELVIPPRETAQITALITAPVDALPGGHYAGIYFESKDRRGASQTVSYTTAQVGSLFALTVEGDINYDALVKDFSTKTTLYEFGPIDMDVVIENQSDTHITPVTTITITNMFGQTVGSLKLDSLNIFPFAERQQTATWDQVWGLGQYEATVMVSYGPGLTTSRTLSFWILPYRLIAAILIILLVLIAAGVSIRRHVLHRQDERDDQIDQLKRKIAEMENGRRD